MSQLYARVFLQILDSSISEDYTMRHIFEDLLKLCDHRTGVVDMTRQALSRRLNIPPDVLDAQLQKLESPDPNSRDDEFEGRRIERLDEHRDWGWRILNWAKYDSIRVKADLSIRVARHREKKAAENPSEKFKKPTVEEVKLYASEKGMPMSEAEKFFHYYEANGWRVGKNPMKNWHSAVANWKKNFEERKYGGGLPPADKPVRDLDVWHLGSGKYNLTNGPKREHFPNQAAFDSHLRMWQSWQANRLRQKEAK